MSASLPPLTRDTLLTPAQAIRALQVRESTGRKFLHDHGLIRLRAGAPRVLWGDVLDVQEQPPPKKPPARKMSRPRASL